MAISAELLHSMLTDLNATSAAIEASAIVSVDGIVLASVLPAAIDADRAGAMSAAMLSLGNRTAKELERGRLEQVLIKSAKGYALMVGAGSDAILTVMAGGDAKLGLIFLAVKKTAELLEGFDLKYQPRMGLVSLSRKV
ncbi:MAG: roadblock/LC7 domain-containing protein [Gammaproteobacteria bacterium]